MHKLAPVRAGASVAWRTLATAVSFAAFGVGGLLLRVLVFPLLHVLVWRREARVAGARAIIRWNFRFYIGLMRFLGVLRYDLRGLDKLDRGGLLILANHPTLIDTIFLMAYVKQADCIVKADLWNNPFTRGPVRAAGYINNTGGAEMVDACLASLARGNNLIIFPEGTRTRPGQPLQLQRGAANVAVRGGFALTPVVIRCEPPTLTKGEKWYHVPVRRPRFVIDVHPDVPPAQWVAPGTDDAMAVRHLTQSLSEFFSREIRRAGA